MKHHIKNYIAILSCTIFVFFCILFLGMNSIALAMPSNVLDKYNALKVELNSLLKNENKAKLRHNWIKLSDGFYNIYINNVNWINRPAALFRSAKAVEEMAYRSYVREDALLAVSRYEALEKKFPTNPLADDALYQAAGIYSELLQDNSKAIAHLQKIQKKYPKSDSLVKSNNYLAKINGNAVASLAPSPIVRPNSAKNGLTNISTKLNSGVVKIVLSSENVLSWRAKYSLINGNEPAIVVTLNGTKPNEKISLIQEFERVGILSSYQINFNPVTAQTVIILKFSDLLRYAVTSEREPAKLIIEAPNLSARLKGALTVKKVHNDQKKQAVSKKQNYAKSSAKLSQYFSNKNLSKIKTIVIDPGHGGKDPGAIYNGITEKVINLDISKRLARVLKSAGYTVYLTRTTDKFIDLDERSRIANAHKADLFISVHANANPRKYINGFETYILPLRDKKSIQHKMLEKIGLNYQKLNQNEKSNLNKFLLNYIKESRMLASMIQKNALRRTAKTGYKVYDGGIREEPFTVLIGPSMPSVLVEVGYSSNPTEAKRLRSSKYKDSLAEGIANGLHQYAGSSLQAKK